MEVRLASYTEHEAVIRLEHTHPLWNNGQTLDAWRKEVLELWQPSGTRIYVLDLGNGEILSSLRVFQAPAYGIPDGMLGLASLISPEKLRGKGYASKLVGEVLGLEDPREEKGVWAHAEVSPLWLERFGFKLLPDRFQEYKSSKLMLRGGRLGLLDQEDFVPPRYF